MSVIEKINKLRDEAAIYLEKNNISGDTMVECDLIAGSMKLHDIMVGFLMSRKSDKSVYLKVNHQMTRTVVRNTAK